jgi:hypothetical protein
MIEKIQAGDTFNYSVNYPDYPASAGWTCAMLLRGAASKTITSTADGDAFNLSAPASDTALYASGNCEYFIYVSKDTDRYLVEKGSVEILGDYSSTTLYDPRSMAQQIYEAVDAALLGRATKDQMSYEIAGRKIEKIPIPDLLVLRSKFLKQVESERRAERIANGLGAGNIVRLRFE